jgi:hypothetical protein
MKLALLVFSFSLFFAFWQARAEDEEKKVVYRKSESHQFSGSRLKGEYKKPDLSYIYERKGIKQEQIIHIPENFNDEIIHGADNF